MDAEWSDIDEQAMADTLIDSSDELHNERTTNNPSDEREGPEQVKPFSDYTPEREGNRETDAEETSQTPPQKKDYGNGDLFSVPEPLCEGTSAA